MSGFIVRAATISDLPAVHDLLVETWAASYSGFVSPETRTDTAARWHSVERLEAQLSRSGGAFLVADEGERVVGHVAGRRLADGVVFLERLYVRPGAQSAGIGSALFDALLHRLPDTHGMRLEVFSENPRAIEFYRRLGFVVAEERADAFGNGTMIRETIMVRAAR